MAILQPARRRGPSRARGASVTGLPEGSVHVAAADHRVYVVAYYRSPEDAREFRGGVVSTHADHDTAPTEVRLEAPGPGRWFVSVLERRAGASGFTFAVGADGVPLLPR